MRKYLRISENSCIFASEKETNNKLNPKTRKGARTMAKKNYQLAVITAAAEAGFTFDMDDTMLEIWDAADNFLAKKEPYGHVFEQVDLNGPDYSQHYSWADDESDYTTDSGGEIITTNGQYTADDKVYYHREEDGTFTPVNWFDLPDEGDDKRREYIFVFAYHVKANGKVAYLYDYFC